VAIIKSFKNEVAKQWIEHSWLCLIVPRQTSPRIFFTNYRYCHTPRNFSRRIAIGHSIVKEHQHLA